MDKRAISLLLASVVSASAYADLPTYQSGSNWYTSAQATLQQRLNSDRTARPAKNVILFIGDGMGVSTLTAARILDGQMKGGTGEENYLSFEKFPYSGLAKTYNTNQQTPDSAGTVTAMMSGVKTKAGIINVSEDVLRGDCPGSQGHELTTALERAEASGRATGIVTTARLTHATPAGAYAKVAERDWEYEAPDGCKDIADQLIAFDIGNGIDVAFGGGRRNFLPNSVTDIEGSSGKRKDGRDLTTEWRTNHPDGVYVEDQAGFDAIPSDARRVFGLFNSSHMQYAADRMNDIAGEPSLAAMTAKAIDVLQKDDDGFFLMVEGGRIDHGHHAGSAYSALTDTIAFSEAVQAAVDKVDLEDTLILVTADHSHVFTIAGYPTRGNPILGKVISNDSSGQPKTSPEPASDNLPYTTVSYTNGLGYADLGSTTDADARYGSPVDEGRKDLTGIDTRQPGYHQEALVPLGSETHAGEDVSIHAIGADAYLVQGDMEQNQIYHVMTRAMGLDTAK